jgi:predicted dinucleotide-binding enzyme
MKIGIIGSGNVGGALGTRWAKNGHSITFAAREPNSKKIQEAVRAAGPNAAAGSPSDAVRLSEVVLLATPFPAAEDAVRSGGNWTGKILIDATNPLRPDLSGLAVGCTESAGEKVAGWAPAAKVVKAFNTVGANIMEDPKFAGGKVALFYCGDDAGAKKTVAGLIGELGFDPLDAGPLTQSRVLEPFAMLWISLALQYGYGRDFAFELLRR